jgi:hypothetical protein
MSFRKANDSKKYFKCHICGKIFLNETTYLKHKKNKYHCKTLLIKKQHDILNATDELYKRLLNKLNKIDEKYG